VSTLAAIRGWRTATLIAASLIAAAAALGYLLNGTPAPSGPPETGSRAEAARLMNDLMSGKVPVGGPFTLTDQDGNSRSLADFRGKLVLLYFGYTYCPDVCPTDMLAMGQLIKSLGREGNELQPVFVTLDPERDTREILRSYAPSFHPRFVALSGTEAEIRTVATAYKIFFEKVRPPGSSTYFIDHMAIIFLLDRDGRYIGSFPPGTTAERMTAMVRERLANPG
jgi:cytochrome oxidase Cu insertion factor (SCO1/SenC/PrrC family)